MTLSYDGSGLAAYEKADLGDFRVCSTTAVANPQIRPDLALEGYEACAAKDRAWRMDCLFGLSSWVFAFQGS